MSVGGIAPALRGGAMSVGGIAPALRGGAMSVACARAVRSCAAACALLLAGCAPVPALTLSGTSSWRARRDGRTRSHAWMAGAQLGWSAGSSGEARTTAPAATADTEEAGGAAMIDSGSGAPCAFDATCSWEQTARSAALQRADTFGGDGS